MVTTENMQISIELIKEIKAVLEPSSQWMPVIAAIGGAAVGGFIPLLVKLIESRREQKRNKEAVAHQIYAEITAILEIVEKRQYLQHMNVLATQFTLHPNLIERYQIHISEDFSLMYKVNIDRLPLLNPSLQTKIVKFYRFLSALIEDVKPGGGFNSQPITHYGCDQFILIATEAISLGEEIKVDISLQFNLSHG
ncbi:hypothetical protein [Polynucleobacter asymbioticus]|jgi:hypothetical protein|uniref:hypothetical protein n=1 Tax=Polynucleobacter asymbioticus TaxID=576611 RepID=UPI0008F80CDE|nr:hypothetical protein [Polynucleobacter asymbioticus]